MGPVLMGLINDIQVNGIKLFVQCCVYVIFVHDSILHEVVGTVALAILCYFYCNLILNDVI